MRAPWAARTFFCMVSLLGPGRGSTAPQAGEALPSLTAVDVTGQPRRLSDLVHGPTLLVAIANRDAGDAMRAWFQAAAARAPGASQVSIISIGAPFFVSDAYARSRAREHVPRAYWHASLFDSDHAMAKKLGLRDDEVPYAFAVAEDGRVLASVRGKPDSPEAEQLWTALKRLSTHRSARRP